MKPSPDLPQLRILPIHQLHPHELPDDQRAEPLAVSIRRDRVLRNPPIVQMLYGLDAYVVLDGANRVSALRLLEVPHVLVQVVDPETDEVDVRTWNHVLLGSDSSAMRERLGQFDRMSFVRSSGEGFGPELQQDLASVVLHFSDGESWMGQLEIPDLLERVEALEQLVDAYQGRVHYERTNADNLGSLPQAYRMAACLVVFPEFSTEEVITAAASGWRFPAGITRFVVSPRALRLNYPLEILEGGHPLEDKQAHLQEWIRERIKHRRVRYYSESTFLFDE
jgi:hypothetical protein